MLSSAYNTYTKKLSGSDIKKKYLVLILTKQKYLTHMNTTKYLIPNKYKAPPPPPGYQMGRP